MRESTSDTAFNLIRNIPTKKERSLERVFFFVKKNQVPVFSPEQIISISGPKEFHKTAMKVYRFQYENNSVYKQFCDLVKKTPTNVKTIEEIPFLPIEFFKTHEIRSVQSEISKTFTSSGTTGQNTSKHHLSNIEFYENSFRKGFSDFYGSAENFTILALLPSYLERTGSSLIYMVQNLIEQSCQERSGFYLNNLDELAQTLKKLDDEGTNTLVIGVSFALLDLTEKHRFNLKNTIIMETGGMKGKRKELIRAELHQKLKEGFGVQSIHSEYGMTELLSQAYSFGDGIFECPPWMNVFIRDTEDPFQLLNSSRTGGINIIDLANIESCSFIATQDLGKKHANGTFEVLGRFDHSDIRGCNLMVF